MHEMERKHYLVQVQREHVQVQHHALNAVWPAKRVAEVGDQRLDNLGGADDAQALPQYSRL